MEKSKISYNGVSTESFSLFNRYCLSPKSNLCSNLQEQDKNELAEKVCPECIWSRKTS